MAEIELSVRRDVKAAVGILSDFAGVRRVWVFGSVAKGRRLDYRSDLDLAVEGLAAADHLKALGMLLDELKLPVDLVCWEQAHACLRAEIERWGVVVYEREPS